MPRCTRRNQDGSRCSMPLKSGHDCGRHKAPRPAATLARPVTTEPSHDPFENVGPKARSLHIPERLTACCPTHGHSTQGNFTAGDTWMFDMDGTLTNVDDALVRNRIDSPVRKERDYAGFHQDGLTSPANDDVAQLARDAHNAGVRVVIVTAREGWYGRSSVFWLQEHNIPFEQLFHRQAKDARADSIVKDELLADIRRHGHHVTTAVDDNPPVVELWCNNDIPTLVVPSHHHQTP